MKKISKYKATNISMVLILSLLLTIPFSCKKMDDMNVDKKLLPNGPYVTTGLIQSMETNIMNPLHWKYQLQQNLNADCFSQYMCSGDPFGNNQNNINYSFKDNWNVTITDYLYANVLNPFFDVKLETKAKNKDLDLYSIALIIKVLAASRVTDVFGPLPYSHAGDGTLTPDWDSQETMYNLFFDELKEAIDQLTITENTNPHAKDKWVLVDASNLHGDYKKWVQVANTLRLRLAIRISKVSPIKAQQEAKYAVTQSFGLLETMPFTMGLAGNSNPLWTVSNSWLDISLGAPLGSLLQGYKDPRLTKYALPATAPKIAGQYIGIRQGIDVTAGPPKAYFGFSPLNIKATDPLRLMSQSESYFLRAEGVLNTWDLGPGTTSAQSFYENGVAASFAENGLSAKDASDYLADMNNNQAKAYVDTFNSTNNVPLGDPHLSTISKQWGGSDAEKLEKIITQKWLALFPDGMEAWSEFRRTGYPKLWPVVMNKSGGIIPSGEFVKRLPYPSTLISTSPVKAAAGIAMLGGQDNGNTKLWWNK